MPQAVTKDTFDAEVIKNNKVVLVDFWAPWCGPCQMLIPTLEEVDKELDGAAKIVKVNVDEESEIAGEYGVMSIPALKIFKNGEIVEEAVGVKSKDDLLSMIKSHL